MSRAICLYLHVHQPFRVRDYRLNEIGRDHDYFDSRADGWRTDNEAILQKVALKSYLPMNRRLMSILDEHPDFHVSLSITGTVIEQMERWAPEVLHSFQELIATGRVEIVGETYFHSLAFFYSEGEFERQVAMHREAIQRLFGVTPTVFRNTELSYNNDLANWADGQGYAGILAEGWDPVLGWRSPNYLYRPTYTQNIKLLMKNYKLSDDIAFRFSNQGWNEWPLTVEKYSHWLDSIHPDEEVINLFMDYETFGEHQWAETGIFDFLEALPREFKARGGRFLTASQVAAELTPRDYVDVPETTTWADTERDLSAWLGNSMQQQAIEAVYKLESAVMASGNEKLIHDWRHLQTSDHFYYMCTKYFNDGDIHSYFSPYESPYEAFINYMNAVRDVEFRLEMAQR